MPYSAFQYLPLAVEMTNNELALSVLGVIVVLVGHHFVLRQYIREAAGVKETSTTELSNQPIHVAVDDKNMTVGEHAVKCGPLVKRVELLEGDVKEIRKKMETDKNEIIRSGEDRAIKIHDRVNLAIEKIGELKGQVGELAKRV